VSENDSVVTEQEDWKKGIKINLTSKVPSIEKSCSRLEYYLLGILGYGRNPLDTFSRYFPVDGETGVMDFGLYRLASCSDDSDFWRCNLKVCQNSRYLPGNCSSTDGVWFPIWRHSFKIAAMRSIHAGKCCHLVSEHQASAGRLYSQFLTYRTFVLVQSRGAN